MNWEDVRKESRTSHGAGIQMNATFDGRISAWGICNAQRYSPGLDRRAREEEKPLTERNNAAGAFRHLSGAGDNARNGLPI
jgi:hypothetical protein